MKQPRAETICGAQNGRARWLLLVALGLTLSGQAQGQEAGLWGWVVDAQTNQPLVAEVSIVHSVRPHIQFFHVRSNAIGAWDLKGLPPGEKIVIARAQGYGFGWKRVVVELGVLFGAVDFALEKAATVEGQVTDELGLPVAGAIVRLAYKDLPPVVFAWEAPEAETDLVGRFRVRNVAPNVDFHLQASHAQFVPGFSETSLKAQPGEAVTILPLMLKRGVGITGRLLDADGNPIPGTEIRLVAKGLRLRPPAGLKPTAVGLHRVAKTDADGHFAFQGLPDGQHLLWVRHLQFATYQQSLELDRAVSLTLSLEIRLQTRK